MTFQHQGSARDEIAALARSGVGFGVLYFLVYTAGQFTHLYVLDWIDTEFRESPEHVQAFLMMPIWRAWFGVPMFLVLVFFTRWSFVGLWPWPVLAGILAGALAGFLPMPLPLPWLVSPLAGYVLARAVDWRPTCAAADDASRRS